MQGIFILKRRAIVCLSAALLTGFLQAEQDGSRSGDGTRLESAVPQDPVQGPPAAPSESPFGQYCDPVNPLSPQGMAPGALEWDGGPFPGRTARGNQDFARPAFRSGLPGTSPQSIAPNFIGDLFGTGNGGGEQLVVTPFYAEAVEWVGGPTVSGFGGITRVGNVGTALGQLFFTDGNGPLAGGEYPAGSLVVGVQEVTTNGAMPLPGEFTAVRTSESITNSLLYSWFDGVTFVFFSTGPNADVYSIYGPIQRVTLAGGGNVGAAPGANVGRVKLAENTSPIPRDRVYVNYSYFKNTPLHQGDLNVNRVTPGFEKTFLGGRGSVEVRMPFATTLDSNVVSGGLTNTSDTEFGNMSVYLKGLLLNHENRLALSAGLGLGLPTASDVTVRDAGTGTTIVRVENESLHLLPFLGFLYTPNDRFFLQGLLQYDFDTNGNPVSATSFTSGQPTGELTSLGRANDFHYAFVGASLGYWIYQDPANEGGITGIALMAELHYSGSMNGGDRVAGNVSGTQYDFGDPQGIQLLNGVVGVQTLLGRDASLTLAYVAPLTAADRQFDGEFRVMFNWLFGAGQNRFSRIQF
ncbi:hypothetical protein [Planctomyces sp. SH-PL14]|uniref:hypothetical protein n=1 Tax=Planctomyces sp. SH-PL14 TaxID=1632864 RepID=UPI0012E7BEB7|nr:hypothetical protein [Planctomyces sp. SH-PL14]